MDIEIQEMTSNILSVDMQTMKSEIVAEVIRLIEQNRLIEQRGRDERSLRTSVLDRPGHDR